ncbi:MAG: putative drug exporter of the RND superfamily [Actinobacteria bacterium]|nr:putative drug exporter of the RND superfamily [Actinomycetota bacterium]
METVAKKRSRRPFITALIVIFLWFGASGVFGPLFGSLSTVQENDNSAFLPQSAESTQASKIIAQFSADQSQTIPTLILYLGEIDESKVAALNEHLAKLSSKPILGSDIAISKYLIPGQPIFAFASQDKKAILVNLPLTLASTEDLLPNDKPVLPEIIKTLREDSAAYAKANGLTSNVTGIGAILGDLFGAFSGIDSSLLFTTLIVVALILIVVYRSPVLWILPLFSSVIALSTAGGIVYLLAKNNAIDLSGQSQGILSVLVLGAATDYALLLISRYREELHHYASRFDAMKAAYKGVFEPILASGMTVIVSLLVLLLSDLSSNRGLGPVGAIGIAASMITILTLLPALLVAFGRWIFWPRIPRFDDVNSQLEGTWAKIGAGVQKRPRKLWIITSVVLVILAGFSTTLNAKGLSTADSFTKKQDSVIGLELLGQHFPGGAGQPTEIIVNEALVASVSAALMRVEGVASVDPLRVTPVIPGQPLPEIKILNGQVVLNATLSLNPDSIEARDVIPVIRETVHAIDPDILVGGSTAVAFDTDVAADHDNKTIIPIVLLLITLILGLLLRSIISAVLLLSTVVLSYFATLGACQLVFEHIFNFKGADTSFPLFAFIFLVALGIDYNIFLMTRVREESAKIGTRAGVIKGLTVTGGVITSAGIVLAATFGVLGVLPLVFLAELGFAVAFGVLLDTLIVRTILVPALAYDIGGKIWWPSKLQYK